MKYLTGVAGPDINPALDSGELGLLVTPASRYLVRDGWTWAADNGCFGKGYPGDEGYLRWLRKFTPTQRARCLFAVAPDVVADAAKTLERSTPWFPILRELGYPVAFVAQDGLTIETAPWEELDVLFIGGSTEWKLGPVARELVIAAHERGKRVHVGRVNSARRFAAFSALGVDTADGTILGFGPKTNMHRVRAWIDGDRISEQVMF